MRMMIAAVVACALATPAFAGAKPAPQPDDVVCKSKRVKSLGSNLAAKRTCLTRAQWAEVSAGARRELQSASERALLPTPIPGAR